MFDKPHKNLESWKQSFDLVSEIYSVTKTFPSDEKFGIVSQLRRASLSIPTNIAEGAARKSPKEFTQFLYISLGSISEVDTLLLLGVSLNFIDKPACDVLLKKLDIIGKLIYGLIKKSNS